MNRVRLSAPRDDAQDRVVDLIGLDLYKVMPFVVLIGWCVLDALWSRPLF